MHLQYQGKSDTESCGVNSKNSQGCTAGFLQPANNMNGQGPPEPCPTGFWCPKGFTCKIPCVPGSLCVSSNYSMATGKCEFFQHYVKPASPATVYNVSLTCHHNGPGALLASDDTTDPSFSMCPGVGSMPLCPAGYY